MNRPTVRKRYGRLRAGRRVARLAAVLSVVTTTSVSADETATSIAYAPGGDPAGMALPTFDETAGGNDLPTLVRPRPIRTVLTPLDPPPATRPRVPTATETLPDATTRPTTSDPESLSDKLGRRGSITFRDTPIAQAVFAIGELWGVNITAGSHLEGVTSGTFVDTPLGEVLDATLTSTGHVYRRVGDSLVVYASPVVGGGGSSQWRLFDLHYTDAAELAEPLALILGETAVVAPYPAENRLMVRGDGETLRLAISAVADLDRPRQQVRITALIYDVGLNELDQIGINFGRDLRGRANLADSGVEAQELNVRNLVALGADLTGGGSSFGFRTVQDNRATQYLLECLHSDGESKLLADPSIVVGDRHEASIRIVKKIPIITANPVQGSQAVFTETQFEEAGVVLQVTPRIAADGTIELTVAPEYSVVAELLATGPVIDSREAKTTVRVRDGESIALGGLRQKTIVETVRGIPYLQDIRFVGRLFRGHRTEVRESELVVFLKPELVGPCGVQPCGPDGINGCGCVGVCECGSATGMPIRAAQAYAVGNDYLDRIPHAENAPLLPCCSDPNCPNHHPRPRINPGSGGLIETW